MRVLILHQAEPKMTEWAKNLQGALQNQKCQVNLIDTNNSGAAPISTAPYDLVVVMSTFRGWWRPIIPIAVDELLKRCTRLEGRRSAAIVATRFNAGRALRFLMHLMEAQGMMVEDFATVRTAAEIPRLAERLARLGRRD